jgi:hypothetical protein
MKVIGNVKLTFLIQKIIVNPKQVDQITIISDKKIKNFKTKEDGIFPQADFQNLQSEHEFTCFRWFDQNTLILANKGG